MFSVTRSTVFAAGLALSFVACATNKYSQQQLDQPPTTLVVRNDNFLEHNVYLLYGGQRIRIGTARSNATSKFIIPPQYVFGATSLQFLLDPIGSRATPVTDQVSVSPGDEVDITIPAVPSHSPITSVLTGIRP